MTYRSRSSSHRRSAALLLGLGLVTLPAAAQQASMEEVLEGFDAPATDPAMADVLEGFDTPASAGEERAPPPAPRPWRLSGAVTASATWAYAADQPTTGGVVWQGLARARTKLNLELDTDLTAAWSARLAGWAWHDFVYSGRDENWPRAVRDSTEDDAELGEAWVRGRLHPRIDLKLGRQIVAWGKSENLRVTDVLNPLDMREPGLADIEDVRLPLTMARFDYYTGPWNITALAIPEIRFDKRPAFGSDFYPQPGPTPPEAVPADGLDNAEYALALNGIFHGWDLGLYAADLYSDQPYVVAGPAPGPGPGPGPAPSLHHDRMTMLGAAVNLARGNWLWKAEAAHFHGVTITAGESLDRSDLLLGVEYGGLRGATVSFEVADSHLHDYAARYAARGLEQDRVQYAVRANKDLLHTRLQLTALVTRVGANGEGGGFTRLAANYDLADGIDVNGGAVLYHGGDTVPFDTIGDADRLFLDWRYSF